MKADKQRIEIAKLCGWMYKTQDHGDSHWCHPEINQVYDTPPDYPNDLNACAEMEMALAVEQWDEYSIRLSGEQMGEGWPTCFLNLEAVASAARATAAQRCEAFLRTLGKWEDGE